MTYEFPAGPAFALSTRRMFAAYGTGHAFDLRRGSDNATMTADYLSNGDLDVATVRAWRGNSTAYISKWYDQSGNGLNFIEATAAKQPELSLDCQNGKAAVYGNAASRMTVANNSAFGGAGNQTIIVAGHFVDTGSGGGQTILGSFDLVLFHGWGVELAATQRFSYYSTTKGAYSDATTNPSDGMARSHIVTRTSGALAFYLNGVADGTATGHGNLASTAPAFLFAFSDGTFTSDGTIDEVAFYASALGSTDIAAIAASHASYYNVKNPVTTPPAYLGASGLKFVASSLINAGQHFQYERTQAWTSMGAVRLKNRGPFSVSVAGIIHTNAVNSSTRRGHEFWIDQLGFLRMRIISNFGTNVFMGARSSFNIADDAWHLVGCTYDGSSTVAGVNFYLDGVQDTHVWNEIDALNATAISTGDMRIANQEGFESTLFLRGSLDEYQFHAAARSPSYMAAHSTAPTLPPASDCVLYYKLDEGSGTSCADASASGFTGTTSGSVVWLGANAAPVITSNGGGATASVNAAENQTAVTTVTATDVDSTTLVYSISGGADAAKFAIGASSGVLTFLVAPDFEVPTDANADNTYLVTVQVSDGSLTDTQAITVTVTNVAEGPPAAGRGHMHIGIGIGI